MSLSSVEQILMDTSALSLPSTANTMQYFTDLREATEYNYDNQGSSQTAVSQLVTDSVSFNTEMVETLTLSNYTAPSPQATSRSGGAQTDVRSTKFMLLFSSVTVLCFVLQL